MKRIIFAGNGKLGQVCVSALQEVAEHVEIVKTDNKTICGLRREQDTLLTDISESDCNLVFLAGWNQFIKKEELENKRYINLHGSLLPKYRGRHSLFWAIMNGEKFMGYTIHEVNEKMDDGDIIYQYKFAYEDYTIEQIHHILYQDIAENLGKVLEEYMNGDRIAQKQNFDNATWVPKRNLEDCYINFSMSNLYLRRLFKALTYPYPLPRILYKSETYEILEYDIIDRDYYCQLGRVVNSDEHGIWVKAKEGLLIIKTIRHINTLQVLQASSLIRIGYRF